MASDTKHSHNHKSESQSCCAQEKSITQPASSCCGGESENTDKNYPVSKFRYILSVQGLDCAEEVAILRRGIGPIVGGDANLAFDVLNGRMMILNEANPVTLEALYAAVKKTGMSAAEWRKDDTNAKRADQKHQRMQTILTSLSGLSVLAGLIIHVSTTQDGVSLLNLFAGHDGQTTPIAEILAFLAAICFGVRYVIVKAWYSAKSLRPDMNLLMVVAVTGAIGIGEWFEAAVVSFLFALSLLLESWSVGRARKAVAQLLDLAPPVVKIKFSNGDEKDMLAADVEPGSLFIVNPGEKIALDGHIVSGLSSINQAPITGESVPVAKDIGDEVFAGTINGEGALEIESSKSADNTTLARIIRMIEEAQSRRAQAEQWVEKFARIYTPVVIFLSIAIFVFPPLLFTGEWGEWFYRALVLLVIACPCALVISTPVSIVSALAASARKGVLIKGGAYVEQPGKLKVIAFDKTGTLTKGEPEVVDIIPLNGHDVKEIIERAAALEARSAHPIALAILKYSETHEVAVTPAENVQAIPGKGVSGEFQGDNYWLGSQRYLLERSQEAEEARRQASTLEQKGYTVIVIGNDLHVCGLIAVADTLRPSAIGMVKNLKNLGITKLVMLTGDNKTTAQAIAKTVGIDEVHAELLPEEKVTVVENLVSKYGSVAMIGDGVNDAPAMARASFGIAMGAMGSDAAIETADIALMSDDIAKLPWLVSHSRRTLSIIHQNIAFSLGVKLIFVVLTFAGFATLWTAIAADVGASLLVVSNALRLLRRQ